MNDEYPGVDPKVMAERKAKNFQERLDFIDKYVEWQKRVPNETWSTAQKKLFAAPRKAKQTPNL